MSDFNTLHNRAVWFDVPVADLPRGETHDDLADAESPAPEAQELQPDRLTVFVQIEDHSRRDLE